MYKISLEILSLLSKKAPTQEVSEPGLSGSLLESES